MSKSSNPLGHPTLHGIAALATIAGFLLSAYTFYRAVGQPGTQRQPDATQTQNVNNTNVAAPSSTDLVNSGTSSIDESYAGEHKYFNDWKPLAVISVILILGGLIALSRGRRPEETKTRR